MKTPICDFVSSYAQRASRLHMPGHKGQAGLGIERLDITEVSGADVLYHSCGIIRESQENAAMLFGTGMTVYSAEGASLAIRAMVYLLQLYARQQGKIPLIAAGRNAHKTFLTAAALTDVQIAWLWQESSTDAVSCEITPRALERYLKSAKQKPVAVYITSPDYLGNVADIAGLSQVCDQYGVLLAVDNAHGAYLRFLPEDRHPITLDAHICCDSAHKTLPALTGGAYLHISHAAPQLFAQQAENAMGLFASTSPSYLILQSLDYVNQYLADGYRQRLDSFVKALDAMKARLEKAGYCLLGQEPLKLTLATKAYGYTGQELAMHLEKKQLYCEFSDPDHIVFMLTPDNSQGELLALETALTELPKRQPILERMPPMAVPAVHCTPRQALMQPSRVLPLEQCAGKVLGSPTVSCPPAIPIVVCGEVIDEAAINVMGYYGITECHVI